MVSPQDMLSSKQLIERTGISRSTLNNYISLGLLPKPVVRPAAGKDGHAPRMGYFPKDSLDILKRITALKERGRSMAEIVGLISARAERTAEPRQRAAPAPAEPAEPPAGPGRFMLDAREVRHPAYLVDDRFAVAWANRAAERDIFGLRNGLAGDLAARNLFALLTAADEHAAAVRDRLLRFHLAVAKTRLSKSALLSAGVPGDPETVTRLGHLYDDVAASEPQPMLHTEIELGNERAGLRPYNLYAAALREGVLFTCVPVAEASGALRDLLSRPDSPEPHPPCLTSLSVLVADIRDSAAISAELAPEAYFELINAIRAAAAPILRKHAGSAGAHAGAGMACYFLPQPERNYVMNAICCAIEMTEAVREIGRRLQAHGSWSGGLGLNIGLDEGEAWLGSWGTPAHAELVALGEAVNRGAALSAFARGGATWATKTMLAKLPSALRQRVRYGIRRRTEAGEAVIAPRRFARVASLVEPGGARRENLQDVAALPVAEIFGLAADTPAAGG
jgi:adenylate cyclase